MLIFMQTRMCLALCDVSTHCQTTSNFCLISTSPSQFIHDPVCGILRISLAQGSTLHLVLLNWMRFARGLLSSLCRSLWVAFFCPSLCSVLASLSSGAVSIQSGSCDQTESSPWAASHAVCGNCIG